MKYLLFLSLFFQACQVSNFTTFSSLSKEEQMKLKPVTFSLSENLPTTAPRQWQDIRVASINEAQLAEAIRQNGKRLSQVVIITTGCGGTPGAIKYLKEVNEKYNQEVQTYLLFSDDYAASNEVKKVLFNNGYFHPSFIIDNAYGEFKVDDRKKGEKFRNSMCKECKNDVIGVPYALVYDNHMKVILHGYPSQKGYSLENVPKDYIGWLLKDSKLVAR